MKYVVVRKCDDDVSVLAKGNKWADTYFNEFDLTKDITEGDVLLRANPIVFNTKKAARHVAWFVKESLKLPKGCKIYVGKIKEVPLYAISF